VALRSTALFGSLELDATATEVADFSEIGDVK
jgi:hypothetical protein